MVKATEATSILHACSEWVLVQPVEEGKGKISTGGENRLMDPTARLVYLRSWGPLFAKELATMGLESGEEGCQAMVNMVGAVLVRAPGVIRYAIHYRNVIAVFAAL